MRSQHGNAAKRGNAVSAREVGERGERGKGLETAKSVFSEAKEGAGVSAFATVVI